MGIKHYGSDSTAEIRLTEYKSSQDVPKQLNRAQITAILAMHDLITNFTLGVNK